MGVTGSRGSGAIFTQFLDAPRISIRGCVRWSVRWSVGHAFVKKSKKVFVKCLKVENGHVGASVVPQGTCSNMHGVGKEGGVLGHPNTLIFHIFTIGLPTDGPTDTPSYRDARTHLKTT